MNVFTLPLRNGPPVPVYDIVPWRNGTQLVAIGPYYNRPGWTGVQVFLNGVSADWWMEEDPNQFCNTVVIDVPLARWSERVDVAIEAHGRTAWSASLPLWYNHVHRGDVALVTLAKHDWPWMPEWIEHHRQIGVEHFYIYNNGDANLTRVLAPYREQDVVTEIPWTHPYRLYHATDEPFWPRDCHWYTQPPQMMHAVFSYGEAWNWLGFFDADEFLVPRGDSIRDTLDRQWHGDRPFRRVGALRIAGKWFGNSGHRARPRGSIREKYLRCERGHTSGTKCFVRPRAAKATRIHWWTVEGETIAVDPCELRFNHYRAISEHNIRRGPQFDNEYTNETEDREVLRWLAPV